MYNFKEEFVPVDLIIISSILSMLFSITYLLMSSTKSFPYFLAFPSPTPCILYNSSIVTGNFKAMSSIDGS